MIKISKNLLIDPKSIESIAIEGVNVIVCKKSNYQITIVCGSEEDARHEFDVICSTLSGMCGDNSGGR
jgi:hypothetical protein